MPGQQTMFAPTVQGGRPSAPELYDEMIVPEVPKEEAAEPVWKSKGKGVRKAARSPGAVHEENTAFAPRDREESRVLEKMEANRKRKQEIDQRLSQMAGNATDVDSPAMENPVLSGAGRQPKMTKRQADYANQTASYRPPAAREAPAAATDPYAAYKKPAETEETGAPVARQPKQAAADLPREASKADPPSDEPRLQQPYPYPMIELLNLQTQSLPDTTEQDRLDAHKLEKTLESFDIPARVQRVTHGPAVTRFELGLVSSGINVRRIMGIADNIALDMAANGGVRIEVPIPGTNLFGVEIPNKEIVGVSLAEVLTSPEMSHARSPLSVALGKDIAGRPVICDLAKMPHLLIAGQTGSGKSVCINSIINSLLFRATRTRCA